MDDILGPEFSSYEACNEASDGARSCYTIIDSGVCPGNSYLANLRNEEEYNFVLTFYNSSNYITIISKNHHFIVYRLIILKEVSTSMRPT